MKKTIALMLSLVCVLSLFAGCGAKKEEPVGMANPVMEVKGLEDINAGVGCDMKAPDGIEVSDEHFYVINTTPLIGEYDFTYNGVEYMLRAAEASDDISGIYLESGVTVTDRAVEKEASMVLASNLQWTRWFYGDMQYSLARMEGGENTDDLYAVLEAIK